MHGGSYCCCTALWARADAVPAHSARGISLLELLVAMSLGAVLSFGLVNLFLQSKTSFVQDEEIARLQENGRWALRHVARELSMAGFYGGLPAADRITAGSLNVARDCAAGWAMNSGTVLEHLNDATAAEAEARYRCITAAEFRAGTDIIAVRRSLDRPHLNRGRTAAPLAGRTVYLRIGENGATASLLAGSAVSSADRADDSGVEVWQYQPQLLYIRDYSVNRSDGIPALCRKRLTTLAARLAINNSECLVEGIENLQVEFGVDVDGNRTPEYYTPAPTAGDLQRAVSARIYLLSRALGEVATYRNDKTYLLGSKTISAAGDGHFRRVMQTTVNLYNSRAFDFQ